MQFLEFWVVAFLPWSSPACLTVSSCLGPQCLFLTDGGFPRSWMGMSLGGAGRKNWPHTHGHSLELWPAQEVAGEQRVFHRILVVVCLSLLRMTDIKHKNCCQFFNYLRYHMSSNSFSVNVFCFCVGHYLR